MSSNQENNPPRISGAITYPSSSAQSLQPAPVQPRQPRNLQGLLRFAMEATKAEDAPGNSDLGPMDEQRRKFLEEALKSLTVDVAQVLQDAIKVLTDRAKIAAVRQGEPLPADVATAFGNLMEFIDDIDIANDFYKMGGFAIFPVCYSSESAEVRANASWVLAELCQNNAYCQARSLECGLLHVLASLLHTEQGTALAKCIYAVSCSCREYPAACAALVASGGCAALGAALTASDAQARTKAAFLIRHLCQQCPEAKEMFIQDNIVETVVNQVKNGRDDTTEHLLGILAYITQDLDPRAMAQCRDPRLGLKKLLEDCPADEEERKPYRFLLERLFENYSPVEVVCEDEADR